MGAVTAKDIPEEQRMLTECWETTICPSPTVVCTCTVIDLMLTASPELIL